MMIALLKPIQKIFNLIYDSLNSYRRQYLGYFNDEDNKFIWINYSKYTYAYQADNIYETLDAGHNVFSVYVNLTTQKAFCLQTSNY